MPERPADHETIRLVESIRTRTALLSMLTLADLALKPRRMRTTAPRRAVKTGRPGRVSGGIMSRHDVFQQ